MVGTFFKMHLKLFTLRLFLITYEVTRSYDKLKGIIRKYLSFHRRLVFEQKKDSKKKLQPSIPQVCLPTEKAGKKKGELTKYYFQPVLQLSFTKKSIYSF